MPAIKSRKFFGLSSDLNMLLYSATSLFSPLSLTSQHLISFLKLPHNMSHAHINYLSPV